MLNFIKNFRNDEDGAVTVDWVVLTAAVVALAIAVSGTLRPAIDSELGAIATAVTDTN
jgi:Flp pilus assembly pilin Flp